jgi:hypothetical protein
MGKLNIIESAVSTELIVNPKKVQIGKKKNYNGQILVVIT